MSVQKSVGYSGMDSAWTPPSSICKKLDIIYASVKKDGSKLVAKIIYCKV